MEGLILVWDMDQTLLGNNIADINVHALRIIKQAVTKKSKVTAIFLLTNNSDIPFINRVTEQVTNQLDLPAELGIENVFDGVMTALDPSRTGGLKRLEDVMELMARKGLPFTPETLGNRVYFFDDLPSHIIREQIPADHYIQIIPPFQDNSVKDETNYEPILRALNSTKGGKKKVRNTRRKSKRSTKHMVWKKGNRKIDPMSDWI
jgi:hypothetical protein